MSKDIIYREDAIKEIEEYIIKENQAISEHPDDIFKYNSGLLTAIQAIHDLSSAQPERKKGQWKWNFADNGWKDIFCSECGWKKNVDVHVSLEYSFCPNCGADMRVGKDDE